MKYLVQHQCKNRCEAHLDNDGWYTKKSFTNPWSAYLYLRENRIFNYKSTYRLITLRKFAKEVRS